MEPTTFVIAGVAGLAVILIADAVDYSRRMAADEAGTYARISSIFRTVVEPGIARHSARIVKNTGDSPTLLQHNVRVTIIQELHFGVDAGRDRGICHDAPVSAGAGYHELHRPDPRNFSALTCPACDTPSERKTR